MLPGTNPSLPSWTIGPPPRELLADPNFKRFLDWFMPGVNKLALDTNQNFRNLKGVAGPPAQIAGDEVWIHVEADGKDPSIMNIIHIGPSTTDSKLDTDTLGIATDATSVTLTGKTIHFDTDGHRSGVDDAAAMKFQGDETWIHAEPSGSTTTFEHVGPDTASQHYTAVAVTDAAGVLTITPYTVDVDAKGHTTGTTAGSPVAVSYGLVDGYKLSAVAVNKYDWLGFTTWDCDNPSSGSPVATDVTGIEFMEGFSTTTISAGSPSKTVLQVSLALSSSCDALTIGTSACGWSFGLDGYTGTVDVLTGISVDSASRTLKQTVVTLTFECGVLTDVGSPTTTTVDTGTSCD